MQEILEGPTTRRTLVQCLRATREMASIVTPPGEKLRVLAVIRAYADESGTHDLYGIEPGAEVAAVVGYVAKPKQWERFTRHWRTRLSENKIDVFHMSDINAKKPPPPYDAWSRSKTERFLTQLAKIARENTWFCVGGMVVVRDFDEVVPDWLKTRIQHPYFFCFEMFFSRLLAALPSDLPEEEGIGFVFDQQQQFEPQAKRAYEEIKANWDFNDRMGALAFGSKRKFLPLQAADLVVYHLRRYLTRAIFQPQKDREKTEKELERHHNLVIGFYDRSNLKKYVAMMTRGRMELANALRNNATSVRLRADRSIDTFVQTLQGASQLLPVIANKRPDLAAKAANFFIELFERGMKVGCVDPNAMPTTIADQLHVRVGLDFEGAHHYLMRAFRTGDIEAVVKHLSLLKVVS